MKPIRRHLARTRRVNPSPARSSSARASLAALLVGLTTLGACALDGEEVDPELGAVSLELISEKNFSVAAGLSHTCAAQLDGTIQCWGRNSNGQLGNGTTIDSRAPVTVVGITTAVAVTTGGYHSCAVLLDGTARCWGSGSSGQLGNGSTASRLTPVVVAGLTDITSLSAGGYHTCASRGDGRASCWGANSNGQLGNRTTVAVTSPAIVGGGIRSQQLTGVAEVETGRYSSCALLTSGGVRCWGLNANGQLGDGTTTTRTAPVVVSGMTTAVDVSVGDYHACVATGTGRARCWGWNAYGQLGDGTTTTRTTPVEVKRSIGPDLSYRIVNVSTVAAGFTHTCVRSAGRAWCMGRNNLGQLGQPATATAKLLAEETPITVTELSAGGTHTCARRPGGTVVCFGDDFYGQVGEAGTCPSNPTLTLVSVTAPDGRLHRENDASGALYYVADDQLDLRLETSACANVSEVNFVYGPVRDGTDDVEPGSGIRYEVLGTLDREDGVRELTVRISFPNPGNGMTFPVGVTLTSPAGNSASAGFTLSLVEAVNAHGGVTSLSRAELYDEVLVGMFEKWGDANYFHRPGTISLYDFDYASMSLFLNTSGINFSFRTKAELAPRSSGFDYCNPWVEASGKFRVVLGYGDQVDDRVGHRARGRLDPRGQRARSWRPGGSASPPKAIVAEVIDGRVANKVEDKVAGLNDICGDLGCGFVLEHVAHIGSTVEIQLNSIYSSVTYRVPYVSTQLQAGSVGDPMRRGIATPADEPVVMMAGGIAEVCKMESGECAAIQVGAAGLFNWNWDPDLLIPDPWPASCGQPSCPTAYLEGRHQAWVQQIGFRRDLDAIPMAAVNPGAVISRVLTRAGAVTTPGPLVHARSQICRIDPTEGAQASRVVVGRNDTYPGGPYGGERGTGDAIVTIGFAGPLSSAVDPCEE